MRKQLKAALLLAAGLVLVVHAVAGAAAADGGFNVAFTVRPKIVLELDQVLAEFGDVFPGDNLRVQALTTRVWSNTLWDLSAYGPDEFTTGSGDPIPIEKLRTKQYAQGPDGWKALTAGGTALITDGPRGGNKENSWDFNLFLDWEDDRLDVVRKRNLPPSGVSLIHAAAARHPGELLLAMSCLARGRAMAGRVVLDGASLTLEDLERVVEGEAAAVLSQEARRRVAAARAVIEDFLGQGRVIYGVTTGFGTFSEVPISPSQVRLLQRNLLLSHAAGVGDPLPEPAVRGMILLRANSLASGHSGVRPEVIDALLALLERRLHPVVPAKGSLGASGDLAPLAHMALALIGEGEVFREGRRLPAALALAEAGLAPLALEAKEGLALINGTQFMTALGALTVLGAGRLSRVADVAAAMTCEALRGTDVSFSERFAAVRPHPGHGRTAANLRRLLAGSALVARPGEVRVQDPYVLRCAPQVHGAGKDALAHVRQVLERELNAVTDNPLVFREEGLVLSGGNFHGQPLALALDYVAIALAEWASIAERRIERLVNPNLSGLPAFLVEDGGLNSGFMLAQYTAAALVSENKVLCHPASVDSIPTSAGQEDHVSMGAIAARKACEVLANAESVLAIELLCAAQALEFRGTERAGPASRAALAAIRERVARLEADRMLSPDIEAAADLVRSGRLLRAVEEVAGSLTP